jgi:hypothetical protein
MPRRRAFGSTNKASSSLSPSVLGSTAANPTMSPFHSATNTRPAVICTRGNSIASGWASKASRSPAFVRDARSCSASSSFCSQLCARRIRKFSLMHPNTVQMTSTFYYVCTFQERIFSSSDETGHGISHPCRRSSTVLGASLKSACETTTSRRERHVVNS